MNDRRRFWLSRGRHPILPDITTASLLHCVSNGGTEDILLWSFQKDAVEGVGPEHAHWVSLSWWSRLVGFQEEGWWGMSLFFFVSSSLGFGLNQVLLFSFREQYFRYRTNRLRGLLIRMIIGFRVDVWAWWSGFGRWRQCQGGRASEGDGVEVEIEIEAEANENDNDYEPFFDTQSAHSSSQGRGSRGGRSGKSQDVGTEDDPVGPITPGPGSKFEFVDRPGPGTAKPRRTRQIASSTCTRTFCKQSKISRRVLTRPKHFQNY